MRVLYCNLCLYLRRAVGQSQRLQGTWQGEVWDDLVDMAFGDGATRIHLLPGWDWGDVRARVPGFRTEPALKGRLGRLKPHLVSPNQPTWL